MLSFVDTDTLTNRRVDLEFGGELRVNAPQEQVWDFLMDAQAVGRCGPGVESITDFDKTHFSAVVRIGIAQFRARFNVEAELVDLLPTQSAGIRMRAQAPGTAVDAIARMQLEGDDKTTLLQWDADVSINGKLAAVGTRLIEWQAERLIADAFGCIKATLETSPSRTSSP
jgi:carbon monoxide dehydrogenase subunit G